MRILLVSQMYPGPDSPDFGIFVADLGRELERRGHELSYAVIDRRGGSRAKYLHLAADAVREARRRRPDVVYAHFLFPAGGAAAAAAFARVGRGSLALVGDGPLRSELEGRPDVHLVGRVSHERVADWIGACDVLCQPSLIEPFGQALLEALASERSVVATRAGGPPEFVTSETGVLVDPASVDSIAAGLLAAAP